MECLPRDASKVVLHDFPDNTHLKDTMAGTYYIDLQGSQRLKKPTNAI
ncbi:MAG: hypothetical protein QGF78_04750 [Candidatus Bathyarchaeota archaeon]|nr:hypothetical protein [Candidatus Bathyarchaeota archaeon]